MSKIDASILEALAQAIISAVQELDASAGTNREHICWVKTNFIKHFTEDVFFLNDHSEDNAFSRRYGNLIIRDILEQLIEFLYILKNPHLSEEYLGLTINLEEVKRKQSIVKKEGLFGEKRYNKGLDGRPSVKHLAKFASDIWQIHPFGEGNTRATAVFMIKYMKTFGFRVNNDAFRENS